MNQAEICVKKIVRIPPKVADNIMKALIQICFTIWKSLPFLAIIKDPSKVKRYAH